MSWSGVKKQSIKADIEAWCDEMGIKNYTINSQSEIDVDGSVSLIGRDFKELPYKFRTITGWFSIKHCKNLISLKNCPKEVREFFSCSYNQKLDSLEGCPKWVGTDFWCRDCKHKFTAEEITSLCNVKKANIYI